MLRIFKASVVATLAALTPALYADNCSASAARSKDIVDTAVAAGSFKTLAAALKAGDLVDALKGDGPFTVFAPTDDAFAALPDGTVETLLKPENKAKLQAILKYHVVSGRVPASAVAHLSAADTLNGQRVAIDTSSGVKINDSKVIKTDIECSNGIIHVIDHVLMPATNDIVDTAVEAGSFKTLAAALQAAGLVDALKGDGPFTVFAPTDEAFAKLPPATLQSLLEPHNREKLAAILKYHVVAGRVYADQVVKMDKAKTLQGSAARIRAKGGHVMVDDANVIKTDIQASNGVIHVIDRVILPE